MGAAMVTQLPAGVRDRVARASWLNRLVAPVERAIKGPIFGCKMCGQCAVSQTGLTCPMTCPKQLRNGPCGGSVGGKCEVYPDMDCVWVTAYRRSQRVGRADAFRQLMLPVDRRLDGSSAWLNHLVGRDSQTYGARELPPAPLLPIAAFPSRRRPEWEMADDESAG
jgi:hypothetical protein